MKCMMCKHGDVVTGKATLTLERGKTTLVFKDVPARVCENCGEEYIDDAVTADLLEEAERIAAQGAEVDVRHFQAA